MPMTSGTNPTRGRALLAAAIVALLAMLAAAEAAASRAPLVHTSLGSLVGVDTGISYEYRGVPFAQPPVGDLRWRPPVEAKSWAPAVYDATANAPVCPQLFNYEQSEDCLYLNVYVPYGPAPRSGRPVQVFLTGGAFVVNGPAIQSFNASIFVNASEHIVVVPSYRLGVLGLMGHPAFLADSGTFGNYVLMDQLLALRWVADNIAGFGGDPERVLTYGQSAGSISIGIHLTTPYSVGLFQRAIMESGAPLVLDPPATYTNVSASVQAFLGCPANGSMADTMACMRAANVSTLMAAQAANSAYWVRPRPAVDGVFIVDQPLARIRRGLYQRNVAVVGGFQTNESAIFDGALAPYRDLVGTQAQFAARVTSLYGASTLGNISALYDISPNATGPLSLPTPFAGMAKVDSDSAYVCPMRHYIRALADSGSSHVWFYRFARNPPFAPPALAAFHTGELAYTFGHPCFVPKMNAQPPLAAFGPSCPVDDPPAWDPVAQPADYALSRAMMSVWAAFASSGNPNHRGSFVRTAGTPWPAYAAHTGYANAVFDADDVAGSAYLWVEDAVNEERCDYWDSLLPPFCGDGVCNDGETTATCRADCRRRGD